MGQEIISENFDGLPAATSAEMRLLDQWAEERHGIAREQLMENAGTAAAREIMRFAGLLPQSKIAIACGRGLNGGDGLVIARILSKEKFSVSAFVCPPKKDAAYPPLFLAQMERAQKAGAVVSPFEENGPFLKELEKSFLIIDAILGTGSSGKPTGAAHFMIQEISRSKKPVIAIDLPSGINPDTGYHSGAFIIATETLTLGLPKRGLLFPHSQKNVGRLKVLDIGYPPDLIKSFISLRK